MEEDKVFEEKKVVSESSVQEEQTEEKKPQPVAGYAVALLDNQKFHFEVFGDAVTIPMLSGLHEYAKTQIKMTLDQSAGVGDAITNEVLKKLDLLVSEIKKLAGANSALIR